MKNLISIFSAAGLLGVFAFPLGAFSAPGDSSSVLTEPYIAESRDEAKPHVGLLIGPSVPNGDYDAAPNYGVEAGAQPIVPIGIGVQFSRMSSERDVAGGRQEISQNRLLLKTTYNFSGSLPVLRYSYIGTKQGPVLANTSGNSNLFLGIGPVVGADFPITPQFTAGLDADYLFITGDANPNAFSFNGLVKYWF